MKRTRWAGLVLTAVALSAVTPATSDATRYVAHGRIVSGPAAVRVWVRGADVFPDYRGVTLWVRPERDCYTSLFLVDTAGFIHVLNAGNRHDNGWLYGGRTYAYHASDLGIDRLGGRGIAYVFAVGSPVPFDYSYYGASVRAGAFGYRIVGDPFTASREFYMSLLPATCRWDQVGVGFTRFYVREWVRYPSYLCAGGHVRVGDSCRHCEPVYASYRGSIAAPYEAIRPVVRYKGARQVVRSTVHHEPIMPAKVKMDHVDSHESVRATPTRGRVKSREVTRVVSTSRDIARHAFEKSRPVTVMGREQTAQPMPVTSKNRKQKNIVLAQDTREKGATTTVRQAE
jgi:hypothetical protein